MDFKCFNETFKPAALLIPAMFCNEELFSYIIEYLPDYHIIVPVLDGHSADDTVFTSVENQSDKIREYLKKENISELAFICGMSLGAIIAFEVYKNSNINIKRAIFDGGPFFDFGKPIKWFMDKVFGLICSTDRKNPKLVNKLLIMKAPYLVNDRTIDMFTTICTQMKEESIDNLTTACYSFSCPELSAELQKKAVFLYGSKEPAIKSMPRLKKSYRYASFIVKKGYRHIEYQAAHTIEYVRFITGKEDK
jgi:hypothetical protein